MQGGVEPVPHALPTLDGYRAIAALMVLTTHVAFNSGLVLAPIIGPIMSRFDVGVCLFFLLSGFLLYRPWARNALGGSSAPSNRVYALRRALRIMPAYVVMACFTLALLPEIQPVPLATWLHYLTLTQIYAPSLPPTEGLTQVWSLATEVAFYVALPLIAWLLGRRRRSDAASSYRWQMGVLIFMIALALAFNALRGWGYFTDPRWILALPSYLDWFALGMVVAVAREALQLPDPPRTARFLESLANDVPTCLVAAACIFAVVCTPVAGPLLPAGDLPIYALNGPWASTIKHGLYGLFSLFLLLPGFLGDPLSGRWRKALASPIPRYLGVISYGIFLWHLVLLRLLLHWTQTPVFSGGFWWMWPATVALSVAAASISWFLIERPSQRWSHRYRPSRRARTPRLQPSEPAAT